MPSKTCWEKEQLKKLGNDFPVVSVMGSNLDDDEGRSYPHRTEDMVIDFSSVKVIKAYESDEQLIKELKGSISPTISDIFSGKVKNNLYVPAKTKCSSLGAVEVLGESIEFYKDENSKLRVSIRDNDGKIYKIKVSSKRIRDMLKTKEDIEKLNQELKSGKKKAHVRVGLAKAFSLRDDRCYLMCNGLFLF
jgi:hypothetical protein